MSSKIKCFNVAVTILFLVFFCRFISMYSISLIGIFFIERSLLISKNVFQMRLVCISRKIFIVYCLDVNFLPKSMSNPPPASCHTGSAPPVPEFTADACEPDEESADLLTRSSIIASFVMMGSLGPCLELPPPPPKPAKIKLGFSPVFIF